MYSKKILTVLFLLLFVGIVSAEVPNVMSYQGFIADNTGAPVDDGPYLVKFIIYDAPTAGSELWNSGFQTITTSNGLFTYQLGDNVALPAGIFSDTNKYLGLTVGTDPEIAPRTRFNTTAYSFQAQNADLASDADSLGGLQPAFYRDWNNLINIPSGFNDGIDDEGISLSTADDNYVSKTGDTMTGILELPNTSFASRGLEIQGDPTPKIQYYGYSDLLLVTFLAGNWAEMLLYDNSGDLTVDLGSNHSAGGFLSLFDPEGFNDIYLNAGGSNNGAVYLPDSAIDNTEILDEPGLASNNNTSSLELTSTIQDIVTVTITIPNSGYIKLDGKCYLIITGSTSGGSATVQIDEDAGGTTMNPYFTYAGFESGYSNTGAHIFSMYTSRVYFKTAGTYTFRLEGRRYLSSGTVYARDPIITAVYFPTSYGSVSTISPQLPNDIDFKSVSTTSPEGKVAQSYKYDLRELEIRAKEAALKAKDAELELLKAQQLQKENID